MAIAKIVWYKKKVDIADGLNVSPRISIYKNCLEHDTVFSSNLDKWRQIIWKATKCEPEREYRV